MSQIWDLTQRYVDRDRDSFLKKVASCDEVMTVHAGGELVYFICARHYRGEVDGEPWIALLLTFAAGREEHRGRYTKLYVLVDMARSYLRYPWQAKYISTVCSTYPAYLSLARNSTDYWPRPGVAIPEKIRAIATTLMTAERYEGFDPDTFLIRRPDAHPKYHECGNDDIEHSKSPEAQDYLTLNPHPERGDTLFGIGYYDSTIIASYIRKALRGVLRRPLRQSL